MRKHKIRFWEDIITFYLSGNKIYSFMAHDNNFRYYIDFPDSYNFITYDNNLNCDVLDIKIFKSELYKNKKSIKEVW
jgi:hypothetical protein